MITQNNKEYIWVEKYRPHKVVDVIIPDDIKQAFQKFVDNKNMPNMLLVGGAGTGKTTISKATLEEMGAEYMMINGSLQGNIDQLHDMANYASCMTFNGMRKYIIIDECLDEDTIVWILRNGKEVPVFIKNLNDKEDLVKSFNLNLNRIEWKPFDLLYKGNQETLEIEFDNKEVIVCTPSHKWYVYDENDQVIEIQASDLYKYNYILTEGE